MVRFMDGHGSSIDAGRLCRLLRKPCHRKGVIHYFYHRSPQRTGVFHRTTKGIGGRDAPLTVCWSCKWNSYSCTIGQTDDFDHVAGSIDVRIACLQFLIDDEAPRGAYRKAGLFRQIDVRIDADS